MTRESKQMDFDEARDRVWNMPGFVHKSSTISSKGDEWFPMGTYVIECIKTDDVWMGFVQYIGAEEHYRVVLPPKVMETLFRQRDSIIDKRRKIGGQRAADTRKAKDRAKERVQPALEEQNSEAVRTIELGELSLMPDPN